MRDASPLVIWLGIMDVDGWWLLESGSSRLRSWLVKLCWKRRERMMRVWREEEERWERRGYLCSLTTHQVMFVWPSFVYNAFYGLPLFTFYHSPQPKAMEALSFISIEKNQDVIRVIIFNLGLPSRYKLHYQAFIVSWNRNQDNSRPTTPV